MAADAKKAADVVILDVGDVLGIADLFVIASGANDRQVRTIVDHVEEALRILGRRPLRREGRADSRWVLLDYGDVVVHVFRDDVRRFYDLERLWADAGRVDWSSPSSAAAFR